MRVAVLAGLLLLALPLSSPLRANAGGSGGWFLTGGQTDIIQGRGNTDGVLGQVTYIKGEGSARRSLQRNIGVQEWRGQRVRVTVRLKSEGEASAKIGAGIVERYQRGYVAIAQDSASGGWQTHQFVMDVPDDGSHLYVYAGFTGKGAARAEGLTLEAVSADVPLSPAQRIDSGGPMAALDVEYSGPNYSGNGGPPYTPGVVHVAAPGPNPPQ